MGAIDWNQISNTLGGVGAAMQGKGQQYRQNNILEKHYATDDARNAQNDKDKATAQRQTTLFTDGLSALRFFNMGRFDQIEQLGTSRLQIGAESFPEADFSGTQEWTDLAKLAQSPDPKVAKQAQDLLGKTLNNGVQIGVGLGILKPDSLSGGANGQTSTGGTVINKDGSYIIVEKGSGDRHVYNPEGIEVMGADAARVLDNYIQKETEMAGNKAKAVSAGTASISRSEKYFDKLDTIRPAIANIDQAIAAIDSGANTGVFMKMLPSFTQASKQLDNVQKRMGLDVVSNTTFGALSKGELDIAVSTALPDNMSPPDLRVWLVEKRNAQVKLADYLESAAIYLSEEGNTTGSWNKLQKQKRDEQGGMGGSAGGGPMEGQTATNNATGEKWIFLGGKWGPQ